MWTSTTTPYLQQIHSSQYSGKSQTCSFLFQTLPTIPCCHRTLSCQLRKTFICIVFCTKYTFLYNPFSMRPSPTKCLESSGILKRLIGKFWWCAINLYYSRTIMHDHIFNTFHFIKPIVQGYKSNATTTRWCESIKTTYFFMQTLLATYQQSNGMFVLLTYCILSSIQSVSYCKLVWSGTWWKLREKEGW